jgi:glyoxylase-like metal-dependent hydrolase (beta-lactamase superfamily II)
MFELQATVRVSQGQAVTVHSIQAPKAGDYVNSHIVETANRLVVVDAQLLLPYARFVREYANRLGKPIDRVFLTHMHPDHFMGLEAFKDLPIYVSQFTQWAIGQFGQTMIDYKRGSMGDQVALLAEKVVLPTGVVEPGPLVIDGVEFGIRMVENSEQSEILQIDLPGERASIVQDVVYNGVHLAVGDKNRERKYMFDGWIAAVEELQSRDIDTIFPGHGEPCGKDVLPGILDYLRFTKGLFEGGAKPEEFKAKVLERYPHLVGEELVDYSVFFLYFTPY